MRKVPVESTGGSGPSLGTASNPNSSVNNITEQDVEASKAKFDADKDSKQLHPKMSSTESTDSSYELRPGAVARAAGTENTWHDLRDWCWEVIKGIDLWCSMSYYQQGVWCHWRFERHVGG